MIPGGFLVDTVHIRGSRETFKNTKTLDSQPNLVKYVPDWFPGAGFKTFANVTRGKLETIMNEPIEYAKESMKVSPRSHPSHRKDWPGDESDESGNASIARSCFDHAIESENQGFEENVIRIATGSMYLGEKSLTPLKFGRLSDSLPPAAMDTVRGSVQQVSFDALTLGRQTASILHTFFLAMALNPDVMKKAHEELDRTVGGERLPNFSDQANLPYTSAIVKEVLRWGCPLPLGVPKRAMVDDTYNGSFIPAGATIIENIWWVIIYESRCNPQWSTDHSPRGVQGNIPRRIHLP
jgi:hypothetical protein